MWWMRQKLLGDMSVHNYYIRVHAFPGSKKELVKKIADNEYEIFVREKAERGEVNKRIIALLQELPEIPQGRMQMLSGHRSPTKMLCVNYEEGK